MDSINNQCFQCIYIVGSHYCQFCSSEFDFPWGLSATFLAFGNIKSPMYSRLPQY
ncbi:hypothetical protein HanPI659440_Chr09g0330801 [Helianthus annuus]|nr:hypothetical protein HanPI659440_Chr09g0330801 [Helianthus annuus]